MKAVTLVKKWNGLLSTAQARVFPHWGTTGHFFISLLYQQQCLDKLSFVMLLNKIHLRKGLSLILNGILVISLLKWFQLSTHQPSFGSQVIPVWLDISNLLIIWSSVSFRCFTSLHRIRNWTEFFNSLVRIERNGKMTPVQFLYVLGLVLSARLCCSFSS